MTPRPVWRILTPPLVDEPMVVDHAYTRDDYEPEPLVLEAMALLDQCGTPGHGCVYVSVQADIIDGVLNVSADSDYVRAGLTLTLTEATDLATGLTEAVKKVIHMENDADG